MIYIADLISYLDKFYKKVNDYTFRTLMAAAYGNINNIYFSSWARSGSRSDDPILSISTIIAAKYGNLDIVKFFMITYLSTPFIKINRQLVKHALIEAYGMNHLDVAEYILKNIPTEEIEEILILISKNDDINLFLYILNKLPKYKTNYEILINVMEKNFGSMLEGGKGDILKYILENADEDTLSYYNNSLYISNRLTIIEKDIEFFNRYLKILSVNDSLIDNFIQYIVNNYYFNKSQKEYFINHMNSLDFLKPYFKNIEIKKQKREIKEKIVIKLADHYGFIVDCEYMDDLNLDELQYLEKLDNDKVLEILENRSLIR